MTDTVDKVIIQSEVQGAQQTEGDLKRLAGALDGVTVAGDSVEKSTTSIERRFQSLERQFGTSEGQYKRIERVQTDVNRAVAQNPALQDRANEVLSRASDRYDTLTGAMTRQAAQLERIASVQRNVNANTGVTGGSDSTARAADVSAYGAALDRLQAKYEPLFAAGLKYKAALDQIAEAERAGAISASTAIQARLQETASYNTQVSALERVALAQKQAAQTTVNRQTVVPDRAADIAAYGAALDRLQAKFDPLFAAGQKYKATLDSISEAERVGAISATQAIQARLAETSSYNTQVSALERVAQAKKDAAQASVNQQTIVPDRGADIAAYGKQLDDLRAKYNPLFAAGQTYKSTLTEINQAVKVGALTQAEGSAAIGRTKDAFAQQVVTLRAASSATHDTAASTGKLTESTGLARHELINLNRQLQDVFVSLQAGQNPLTVAVQQGTQIADVFAATKGSVSGFFDQMISKAGTAASAVGAFITPAVAAGTAMATLATAGIIAAVQWASSQRDIEIALAGIGRQSGVTAADINQIGQSTAATTRLSIGQATELATAFAATGQVAKANIGVAVEATEGLAKALGIDATDAATILSASLKDPAKGVDELNSKVGGFNVQMKEMIAQSMRNGDVQTAQALILRGVKVATEEAIEANKKWTDSFGDLWKWLKDTGNAMGEMIVRGKELAAHDFGGAVPSTGVSKKDQLATAQTDLSSFQEQLPANLAANAGSPDVINALYAAYARLIDQVERLKQGVQSQDIQAWNKQLDNVAVATNSATQAMIPEIEKLKQLDGVISDLTRARNFQIFGNQDTSDVDAALTAANNVRQATAEAKGEAENYNARIVEITNTVRGLGEPWAKVSQSTALAHQAAVNQLPVIEAIGNAAKMAAQYAADYQNALDKGKPAADALVLASDNLAKSQAAANAAAKDMIQQMKDQNELAKARTVTEERNIAARQKYNEVMKETRDPLLAEEARLLVIQKYNIQIDNAARKRVGTYKDAAAAAQQEAQAAQAAANAWDQTYTKTSGKGTSASQSGAGGSGDAAAFGSGAVSDKGSYTSTGTATYFGPKYQYAQSASMGGNLLAFKPATPLTVSQQTEATLQKSGIDAALAQAQATMAHAATAASTSSFGFGGGSFGTQAQPAVSESEIMSTVGSLYDLKNAQTTDSAVKVSNLNTELAWLQSRPETIARDQRINQLMQSIDQLNKSTDALGGSTDSLNSTMKDVLSPYYTQDPRTSNLGFRAPGMASGGEFTVPGGYSASDNMLAQIPVASGEIVSVNRPSQMGGSTHTITINMPVSIRGNVSKDEVGRTMYQVGQSMAKQLQAAR